MQSSELFCLIKHSGKDFHMSMCIAIIRVQTICGGTLFHFSPSSQGIYNNGHYLGSLMSQGEEIKHCSSLALCNCQPNIRNVSCRFLAHVHARLGNRQHPACPCQAWE